MFRANLWFCLVWIKLRMIWFATRARIINALTHIIAANGLKRSFLFRLAIAGHAANDAVSQEEDKKAMMLQRFQKENPVCIVRSIFLVQRGDLKFARIEKICAEFPNSPNLQRIFALQFGLRPCDVEPSFRSGGAAGI
jgi:hypothetical protein